MTAHPVSHPHPKRLGYPFARDARLGLYFASVLFFSGCQSQSQPAKPTALPNTAITAAADSPQADATLRQRIVTEIGTPQCASSAQCRTLALGAKACGGPQTWLAWSTSVSREDTLRALSDELAAVQRLHHAQSGMVSNCRYMADPGAVCQANQCVLQTSGSSQ